ncbi:MAG: molybdate ABC transporter substrate-binding protein [Planctomycetaceae bacterium]|nr:molybdate ABC transporter substrate-binding protein [Planctomycetaceae bacterium]
MPYSVARDSVSTGRSIRCASPLTVPIVAVCSAVILAGCDGDEPAGVRRSNRATAEVTVFAAASTLPALEEIAAAYRDERGEVIRTSFAGSSTLAQQILQGAEADVFVSAHVHWADFLADAGLEERRVDYLSNTLVVVVPQDTKPTLTTVEDLLSPQVQRVAMGDPEHVPAGMYAKEALMDLGAWPALKQKIVAGADVRHAVALVSRGEVDAGIVYATDAVDAANVCIAFELNASAERPIRYPLVLTVRGGESERAVEFYEFLQSPTAAAIWRRQGFVVLVRDLQDGVSAVGAVD